MTKARHTLLPVFGLSLSLISVCREPTFTYTNRSTVPLYFLQKCIHGPLSFGFWCTRWGWCRLNIGGISKPGLEKNRLTCYAPYPRSSLEPTSFPLQSWEDYILSHQNLPWQTQISFFVLLRPPGKRPKTRHKLWLHVLPPPVSWLQQLLDLSPYVIFV